MEEKIVWLFIVDDDPFFREGVSGYFSEKGHSVITARSGRDAINTLADMNHFNGVFLIDMHLGGKPDGIGLIKWMRQNGIYNPVVAISGYPDSRSVKKCINELGVSCFIAKPASLRLIELSLEMALSGRSDSGLFIETSMEDGTVKFLDIHSGYEFSAISLPDRHIPWIICCSSQTGCDMGCKPCITGQKANKNVRNLTVDEILKQIYVPQELYDFGKEITISFMGMGEPTLNLDSISRAIDALEERFSIAISTVGIFPFLKNTIDRFLGNPRVEIQYSLHFPYDEMRTLHIPTARNNPIDPTVRELRRFSERSSKPVCLNYTIYKSINDRDEDAEEFSKIASGWFCEVKTTQASPLGIYRPVTLRKLERLESIFDSFGVKHRRLFPKGSEVGSACGQMRGGFFERKRRVVTI
jgi:23S rRNA (adenine2503-C2)-methyltransferase